MKAKLRAWLIDLVREAIRSESVAQQQHENIANSATAVLFESTPKEVSAKFKARFTDVSIEPSFEQMQADALKAQEKYYEPA